MTDSRTPITLAAETLPVRSSLRQRFWEVALNLVLLAVAAHSVALGITLLFLPRWALEVVGWDYTGQMFWPSQAGLFLVILGVAYASATRVRPLVWLVIGSKASAVVFLPLSVVLLDAPAIVPVLGCGDALMGIAVAIAYWEHRRAEASG
jgi:hypothetical protein